ncbi:SRF-TF domain-containing protein/K-box domain-containing protein [Cephalotus follicularis]|uniref:SRF-TF domain-containing protein/K-box domain-containing protein n=1 Tax=Cephalotus follicularis TaxID=3775 RepID=A0A1Q3BW18_CEPFO|nr:SRF-TF domain-containing protein/K-box domain-containing protein [Cephalotus follicularis]
MGRGKIEIKKIENLTNRQVTYSKRRNGIFKKAQELTVLCDAKVSLIMISTSGKYHEYISPTTTTKEMYDQYQRTMRTDLWSSHYERMQEHLRKLKEINNKLRREIRQRMGEDLDDLSFNELNSLEQKLDFSSNLVRQRKYHKIKTQTETYKKKVKSLEQIRGKLLLDFEAKCEDPQYGLVDNEGEYESVIALANGASNLYAFRLHHSHSNLSHGEGFGLHDLRLP